MPILWVLVRYPDGRREPEAFLCTDTGAAPRDVLDCFNRRRAEAVKVPPALPVEYGWRASKPPMRKLAPISGWRRSAKWSDPAIFRTTPVLLGLYSVATLYVHQNAERLALSPRQLRTVGRPLRRPGHPDEHQL